MTDGERPVEGRPGSNLGRYRGDIEAKLAGLEADDVIGRIWRKDHTVWKPGPAEIADRLGWLTTPGEMLHRVPEIEAFVRDVRGAGYCHVVLLGMGGSSLGPEVMRTAFGGVAGYPRLMVLDSTIPASVRGVMEAIDPARALFLVSSKSGSTIEPNCLYAYFRELVERGGSDRAGDKFVAITDPGTSLERLAVDASFRRVFLNLPDIGGRYSVLSYFGLAPAALMGIDVARLLASAEAMAQACGPDRPLKDNPGAWLGAAMAWMALQGRDKLTLITSPSIGGFGLWVEQMLAESTGKDGRGIVPVADESLLPADEYGPDRQFVYLRLEGDDNSATDAAMADIDGSDHPLIRIELRDLYDLGAEFYRWEFATAVAGCVLGIHPFDQPDVQAAKDMTDSMLERLHVTGSLPVPQANASPDRLLADAQPGAYVAILAYCWQTPETDRGILRLRRRIAEQHGVVTTMGYGPRYLHSTGQLHKGGPASGVYVLLTADDDADVPIPGRSYTFGQLAQAQALGDLQALQTAGRPVAWVHLGNDPAGGIDGLAASLGL